MTIRDLWQKLLDALGLRRSTNSEEREVLVAKLLELAEAYANTTAIGTRGKDYHVCCGQYAGTSHHSECKAYSVLIKYKEMMK
jgi:hypothetical protein